ncbi:MAG TPA: hypothetical protein VF363_12510 [Candidatus Eisenbacteria bacterium]
MQNLLALLGATLGGWIGWWLGAYLGLFPAFFLSLVGTAAGLYGARRLAKTYFG